MTPDEILKLIDETDVRYVDFRFTDTRGKEQHVSVPAGVIDDDVFVHGKMFDGSSIAGWKDINESDMILMPDPASAVMDPFMTDSTMLLRCDVIEPTTMERYERDPRSIAEKAEEYLQETGIADVSYFGPEPEFFIFDEVRWDNSISSCFYAIDSEEGSWNSGTKNPDDPNTGHRPIIKGGYFPVPPVDRLQDLRSAICETLIEMGVAVEVHHHEVATGGQCEIGTRFDTLTRRADINQILKYVVHNVSHNFGKTATFMPKPLVDDNGSGMHVHQSLSKDGENLFAGDGIGGMSELGLHYIGGIIKHARAINAFANASTNSYKRLVPGFEAPTMLVYSAHNRSAAIRIPYVATPKERRIEVRFGDSSGNPYLTFAAMLMAGLDGIKNKIDPGEAMDRDMYTLTPQEEAQVPQVCRTLHEALHALDEDRDFLKEGGVFTDDVIDAYLRLKTRDVVRFRNATHPIEFEMYYSV